MTDFAKEARPCTCHPDDKPPVPCPRRYAYAECVSFAAGVAEGLARAAEIAREIADEHNAIVTATVKTPEVWRVHTAKWRTAKRIEAAILAASPPALKEGK